MGNKLLFSLLLAVSLISCKRATPDDPNTERQTALHQRFHGKYKIISTTAKESLDLNLDGVGSVNLMEEYDDLKNCELVIHIWLPPSNNLYTGYHNLFGEFWPEPYFSNVGPPPAAPAAYDPTVSVAYANQGVIRTFEFTQDLKSMILNTDEPNIDSQRYTRPNSILIKEGDIIEVIKTKRFYTSSGWKNVEVTTVYKRYTMQT